MENSNSIPSEKKINHSLNFIKVISLFAVICIHCLLFEIGTEGLVIDALARFAVPIFFMLAGFFSFYNNDDAKAYTTYKRRINKLIKILVIGSILYFVGMVYLQWDWLLSVLNLDALFGLIIFDITPFGYHLWFIQALIYCYILFCLLIRFQVKPNILYKFIPISLLACLFIGECCTKAGFEFTFEYYRNFLLMGLPFFTLGYLIHDKKDILMENTSNSFLIAFAIFGFLLTFLEVLVVGKLDIFCGSIISSVCIFLWCVKNPNTLNFKTTEFIGGKLYGLIYVLHVLIFWMIAPDFGYLNPIIVFIATVIICAIIHFTSNKLNLRL